MNVLKEETALACLLEDFLVRLDRDGYVDDSQDVVPLGPRQATAYVTVDGIVYSLTLTRES